MRIAGVLLRGNANKGKRKKEGVMVLGLSLTMFTAVHVVLSLIGIFSGIVVLIAMMRGRNLSAWTALFLASTVLTSVTGFLFPSSGFTPAQGVGILSLIVLAVALIALYVGHLAGAWRWIYVVAAVIALYFNVFVAVAQAFQKSAFLQPLAPTQSEPPFLVAQLVVLVIFVGLGINAVRAFRPKE
jgi:hypothetical protein